MRKEKDICIGLAEICEGLRYLDDTTPAQAYQYKKYANIFRKLSKIKKQKQKEVIIKMPKRLSAYQKEEREVNKVVQKIRKFEKVYPQNIIERGCVRYKGLNYQKRSAQNKIKKLQKEIDDAKKKLRR